MKGSQARSLHYQVGKQLDDLLKLQRDIPFLSTLRIHAKMAEESLRELERQLAQRMTVLGQCPEGHAQHHYVTCKDGVRRCDACGYDPS
jgi:hypothetical protein